MSNFEVSQPSEVAAPAETGEAGTPLDAALAYADRGWPVLPLQPGDKVPLGRLVRHGVNDATTDKATIRDWWAQEPTAGVGIALEPAGLLDVSSDCAEWDEKFRELGLPPTLTWRSGGGEHNLHHLYRRPEDCPVYSSCHSGKYDLKTSGYAVAPPSVHPSGRRYEVLTPLNGALPEGPQWAVDMLVAAKTHVPEAMPLDLDEPPVALTGRDLELWRGERPARKPDGEVDRSETLWALANVLASAGLTRRGVADGLRDRDVHWWGPNAKYAGDGDGGWARYLHIVDKVLAGAAGAAGADLLGEGEGAAALAAVEAYYRKYVAYPNEHAAVAHTLWTAHTWAMDAWDSTPRLAFISPEPSSGKTRGLEVTEGLVPNPVNTINCSAAYLFRKIGDQANRPTVLFDEIDTIFGPKAAEHEETRGVLNAGHRRGASAGRCVVVGGAVETREYPAYAAVAMAGLGDLPDTIFARTIAMHMRRRAPSERVTPFRRREALAEAEPLCARLAQVVRALAPQFGNPWPEMPPGVEDRDADVWEALLAVADAAGGEWPARARAAAMALVAESKATSPSLGVRLLGDLRAVFGKRDFLPTADLVTTLVELEEAPWSEINRGKPLNAQGLARRLAPFGVKPHTQPGGQRLKGYSRSDFADAWERYLPPVDDPAASPQRSAPTAPTAPIQAGRTGLDAMFVADPAAK